MEHVASLRTMQLCNKDVLHLHPCSLESALAELTGQGPACMVPGQYSPPAGIPLPYTSCATLLPSIERAARGFVCSKASTSQEIGRAPPTMQKYDFNRRPTQKHDGKPPLDSWSIPGQRKPAGQPLATDVMCPGCADKQRQP